MKTCWAQCLGNCSGKISREHPISPSVFGGDEIVVQGFPWCRDRPKKISVANLTEKVLCQKHNSDLSDIDKAGSDARKGTWTDCEKDISDIQLNYSDAPGAQSVLQQSRSSWLDMKNIYCGYYRGASYTGLDGTPQTCQ